MLEPQICQYFLHCFALRYLGAISASIIVNHSYKDRSPVTTGLLYPKLSSQISISSALFWQSAVSHTPSVVHLSLGRPFVFHLIPILGFPVTVCFLAFSLRVQTNLPFFFTSHLFLSTSVVETIRI